MLKFYSLVAILSALVHCVLLQVQASKCSTRLTIIIIEGYYFKDCPTVGVIMNTTINLVCGQEMMVMKVIWKYVQTHILALSGCPCGRELWTNTEARVACNQLGYPNTTTLGKYPQAITLMQQQLKCTHKLFC